MSNAPDLNQGRYGYSQDVDAVAIRYAAELIDEYGVPTTYERTVELVAVAYLAGGNEQLRWARARLRGDES